jgi:hypothetical protein
MDKEQKKKRQHASDKVMWEQLDSIITTYKPGDALVLVKISDIEGGTNTRVMSNCTVKHILPLHRAFQEIIEVQIGGVADEFGPLEAAKLIAQIMTDNRDEDEENADE